MTSNLRLLGVCACATLSLINLAGQPAAKAPSRPPMDDAERMTHIPPLPPADTPLVTTDTTFEEQDGQVVIEAEHFVRQSRDQIRRWYFNSATHTPTAQPVKLRILKLL